MPPNSVGTLEEEAASSSVMPNEKVASSSGVPDENAAFCPILKPLVFFFLEALHQFTVNVHVQGQNMFRGTWVNRILGTLHYVCPHPIKKKDIFLDEAFLVQNMKYFN